MSIIARILGQGSQAVREAAQEQVQNNPETQGKNTADAVKAVFDRIQGKNQNPPAVIQH